jgi:hypothetical protein
MRHITAVVVVGIVAPDMVVPTVVAGQTDVVVPKTAVGDIDIAVQITIVVAAVA